MDYQAILKGAAPHELFALFDTLMCELRSRGLVRSSNNPVADYTEWLAAKALGLTLEPKSTTGFDGVCSKGLRYEMKGRRRTPQNRSVQLSQIRGLDKCHFHFLVAVIFKPDFSIDYAAKIPHAVVMEKARFSEHTNASILQFKPEMLKDSRVLDLTKKFAAVSLLKDT